jgi:hypothetical protein
LDSCDAYLEFIESDAIKNLIDRIYSIADESEKLNQSQDSNDDLYQKITQRIDALEIES